MKTTLLIMLFLVSVLFAVDRASGHGSANKSRLSFVDLTDDFDRVWAETKDVARDRRVEAFEAEFGKILPGFYSADRVKDFITPEHYHDMILKGLEDHQPPRCHPTRQRLVHQTHHARAASLPLKKPAIRRRSLTLCALKGLRPHLLCARPWQINKLPPANAGGNDQQLICQVFLRSRVADHTLEL